MKRGVVLGNIARQLLMPLHDYMMTLSDVTKWYVSLHFFYHYTCIDDTLGTCHESLGVLTVRLCWPF